MALILVTSFTACNTSAAPEDVEALAVTQEDFDALQAERDALAAELERIKEEIAAREAEDAVAEDTGDEYELGEVETQESAEESIDANTTPVMQETPQPQARQQPAQQQTQLPEPQAQPQQATAGTATNGTGVFAGVHVTVNDTTTVATTSGMPGIGAVVFNFLSADGRVLGSISSDDYMRIMERNGINDGGEVWFADQFNRFRGLTQSAGEAFVEANADRQEQFRRELIRLVNVERERAGLAPYTTNQDLMRFSQIRAQELATQFSHTRPNGLNAGYEVIHAGSTSPEGAMRAWMNSSGHRAAILNDWRTNIGVGVYITQDRGIQWQMYFYGDDLSNLASSGFNA